MSKFFVFACIVGLLASFAPATASNWGGATLDGNLSFGEAHIWYWNDSNQFTGNLDRSCWIPAGGLADWTELTATFTTPAGSTRGLLFYFGHVNKSAILETILWIDDVTVTSAGGLQLLNDPGFESLGNGYFPWNLTGQMAYAVGEGRGGTNCAKATATGWNNGWAEFQQYDAAIMGGTGTFALQGDTTYTLSMWVKTAEIVVPEPGTIVGLLSGLGALAAMRRRRA